MRAAHHQRRKGHPRAQRRARGALGAVAAVCAVTACVLGPGDSGPADLQRRVAGAGSLPDLPSDTIVATETTSDGTAAGPMQGSFAVSQNGEATYRIPIWVPPGRQGIQPSLALAYSSSAGEGVAGKGWSIEGLHAISRCGWTVRQDGQTRAVDFTDQDRFCLDGQRLVSTGADPEGTGFRLEHDDFTKVVAIGSLGSPASFKVYRKNGVIEKYGTGNRLEGLRTVSQADANLPDAGDIPQPAITTQQVTLSWPISELADRYDNKMKYTYVVVPYDSAELYVAQSYELLLTSVEYTFKADDTGAKKRVDFWYVPKEVRTAYVGGFGVTTGQALNLITVKGPVTLTTQDTLRRYLLAYSTSPSTGQTLLSTVQECAGALGPCKRGLGFSYSQGTNAFGRTDYSAASGAALGGSIVSVTSGDINGDGREDLLFYLHVSTGETGREGWYQMLSTSPYSGALSAPTFVDALDPANASSHYAKLTNSSLETPLRVMDLNGDGRGDLFAFRHYWYTDNGVRTEKISLDAWIAQPTNPVTFTYRSSPVLPGWTTPSPPLSPTTATAFVAGDTTGDAAADFIVTDPANQLVYTTFSNSAVTQATLVTDPGTTFITDVDGDGTDELLGHAGQPANGPAWWYSVAKLLPNGTYSNLPIGLTVGKSAAIGLPQDFFLDLNGDGLPECLSLGPWDSPSGTQLTSVAINTGKGFSRRRSWSVPVGGEVATARAYIPFDFDSDGRTDLLLTGSSTHRTGMGVLRSAGTSWGTFQLQDTTNAPLPFPDLGYVTYVAATLDANGDGQPDIAELVNGTMRVYVRNGTAPDLLATVTDSLGASTTVEYGSLADPAVNTSDCAAVPCAVDMAPAVHGRVVSGFWLPTGNTTSLHYHRTYANGRADLLGRGWLGFESVTTSEDLSFITTTTHHLNTTRINGDYPYASLPSVVETRWPLGSGRSQFQRITSGYGVTATVAGASFIHEDFRTEEWFEGLDPVTPGPTTAFQSTSTIHPAADGYDAWGNETHVVVITGDGDSESTTWTYATPDTTHWLVGIPTRTTSTSTDTQMRSRTVTTSATADPMTGDVATVTVEPDSTDPSVKLTFSYQRNTCGQVTTTTSLDMNGVIRTSTVGYDAEESTFPTTFTNALNQTQWLRYHPGLGEVAVVEDSNGISARGQYDGFGRVKALLPAASAVQSRSYRRPANGKGVLIQTTDTAGADSTVTTDSVGHQVQVDGKGVDGAFSHSYAEYDGRGRLHRSSRPTSGASGTAWETLDYDNLSRVITDTLPDASTIVTSYTGLTADQWDQRSVHRKVIGSQSGLPLRSSVFQGSLERATVYEWGPFGQLTKATDPGGHATTITYDVRGRRVSLDRPDTHLTTYGYNAFDELISTADAQSRLTYVANSDALGRPLQIGTPDGVNSYQWDTAAGAGIGKLAWKQSADGTRITYGYDANGRPSTRTWRVTGVPELATADFTVGLQYDSAGRLSGTTYPTFGGAALTATRLYGANGKLNRVQDGAGQPYWRLTSVAPDGMPLTETLGAATTSQHYYDTRGRERFLRTANGAQTIQALAFQYDATSNLTSRSDLVGRTTEDLQYDELNRLTDWKTYQDCGVGETQFGYDVDGNLLSRTILQGAGSSATFGYTGASGGPHAVKTSPWGSYTYDNAGNQLTGPGRTVTYTGFNLPATLTTATDQLTFKYDADENRTLKSNANGDYEVTIGDLYILRKTSGRREQVLRISNGTRAVAEVHRDEQPNGLIIDSVAYLHPDGSGSVESVTDPNGVVLDRRKYDPFGERRSSTNLTQAWTPPRNTSDGFAGHRYDDESGLVNMKGRIYDPRTARFLSADPLVGSPLDGQSFNAYTYVLNNPHRYTDPSGFYTIVIRTGWEAAPTITFEVPGAAPADWFYVDEVVVGHPINWDVGHVDSPAASAGGPGEARGSDPVDRSASTVTGAGGRGGKVPTPLERAEIERDLNRQARLRQTKAVLHSIVEVLEAADLAAGAEETALAAGLEVTVASGAALVIVAGAVGGAAGTIINYYIEDHIQGWLDRIFGPKAGIPAPTPPPNRGQPVRLVIGKVADLQKLGPNEKKLKLDPDLGDPVKNWERNYRMLLQETTRRVPIRDATVDETGALIWDNTDSFLDRERHLLIGLGWVYDRSTTLWMPPGPGR